MILLLFGGAGGAAPNVVETTASLSLSFEAAADYEVIAWIETNAAVALSLEAVADYEVITWVEPTAAVGLSIGHSAASKIWVVPTASVALSLEAAVSGWTRARGPAAVVPVSFAVAATSSPYPSDSILLDIVWDPAWFLINGGVSPIGSTATMVSAEAYSTAGPAVYYRLRLDGGTWGEWTAWTWNSRLDGVGPIMLVPYDFLTEGPHYLDMDVRDADEDVASLTTQYIEVVLEATTPREGGHDPIPTRIVVPLAVRSVIGSGLDPVPVRIVPSARRRR